MPVLESTTELYLAQIEANPIKLESPKNKYQWPQLSNRWNTDVVTDEIIPENIGRYFDNVQELVSSHQAANLVPKTYIMISSYPNGLFKLTEAKYNAVRRLNDDMFIIYALDIIIAAAHHILLLNDPDTMIHAASILYAAKQIVQYRLELVKAFEDRFLGNLLTRLSVPADVDYSNYLARQESHYSKSKRRLIAGIGLLRILWHRYQPEAPIPWTAPHAHMSKVEAMKQINADELSNREFNKVTAISPDSDDDMVAPPEDGNPETAICYPYHHRYLKMLNDMEDHLRQMLQAPRKLLGEDPQTNRCQRTVSDRPSVLDLWRTFERTRNNRTSSTSESQQFGGQDSEAEDIPMPTAISPVYQPLSPT